MVSSQTIVDIVHATCGSTNVCLINSTSPLVHVCALVSVPNLTPAHFRENTTFAYIHSLDHLIDESSALHRSVMEQTNHLNGFWYQDMMKVGAIHLPASIESVNKICLSYRSLLYREPNVIHSGMQQIAMDMRKRFLAATPLKVVVRVHGGEDWPTEVYRCEPSLREYVEQHDDFLRFAN